MKKYEIELKNKYNGMKKRCYYKKAQNYYLYGERGIVICKEWIEDFNVFYNWAKDKYFKEAYIDRINVNGMYEPKNCRFVNAIESANNKRNNVIVVYKNKNYTIADLSRHKDCNVNYKTLNNRIVNLKWNIEKSLKPIYSDYNKSNKINKKSKILNYKNKDYSMIGLCRFLNIENKYHIVKARINKLNWSVEKSVIFN